MGINEGCIPVLNKLKPIEVATNTNRFPKGEAKSKTLTTLIGEIMTIVTMEIDLAKNVFAVHGTDATDKALLLRSIEF